MGFASLMTRSKWILLLFAFCFLLSSCTSPGGWALRSWNAAPVIKIGLIAPFEGLGRPLGYAVLPAVKAAIAEANASGQLGSYRVALVALNDDLDARTAAFQAMALVQDADVVAVLGPFDQAAAQAAIPVLAYAGLPALLAAPLADVPGGMRSLCPSPAQLLDAGRERLRVGIALWVDYTAASASQDLTRGYASGASPALVGGPDLFRPWLIGRAGSAADGTVAAACAPVGMMAPGEGEDASLAHPAALADFGARVLLRAIAADIAAHGGPARQGVAATLSREPIEPGLAWYRVENGKWVRAR